MSKEILKINANGETLIITKTAAETGGQFLALFFTLFLLFLFVNDFTIFSH